MTIMPTRLDSLSADSSHIGLEYVVSAAVCRMRAVHCSRVTTVQTQDSIVHMGKLRFGRKSCESNKYQLVALISPVYGISSTPLTPNDFYPASQSVSRKS